MDVGDQVSLEGFVPHGWDLHSSDAERREDLGLNGRFYSSDFVLLWFCVNVDWLSDSQRLQGSSLRSFVWGFAGIWAQRDTNRRHINQRNAIQLSARLTSPSSVLH